MDIEIRKLTPELADDYVHFFDITPHDDNKEENKCYCVCWCSADHRIETDFSSPAKRRDLAVRYINSGILQGYLAYYENQVVGWCNANSKSDCLNCISWLRFMQTINTIETNPSNKVKSIFCFVITPTMQRKGIATLLLKRACEDATNEGFDFIEAYPYKEFSWQSSNFGGYFKMYEKCGFFIHQELNNNEVVMRKQLQTKGMDKND